MLKIFTIIHAPPLQMDFLIKLVKLLITLRFLKLIISDLTINREELPGVNEKPNQVGVQV